MISYYGTDAGLSPEQVLLEKERREVLVGLVKDSMEVLGHRDRKILWLYIKGLPYRQIGEKLGISKQAVDKRLKNIPKKIQEELTEAHLASTKAYLLDNPSTKEADVPREVLGWPCVSSQKIAIEGRWARTNRGKVYRSQTKCVIPEYLRESFGREDVCCTLCNDLCKRKEDYG